MDAIDGMKLSQGLSLGLNDFELVRVIGRGSYAKVLLVRLKKNDQLYAMKVVKKELVHDDEVSGHTKFLFGTKGLMVESSMRFLWITKPEFKETFPHSCCLWRSYLMDHIDLKRKPIFENISSLMSGGQKHLGPRVRMVRTHLNVANAMFREHIGMY